MEFLNPRPNNTAENSDRLPALPFYNVFTARQPPVARHNPTLDLLMHELRFQLGLLKRVLWQGATVFDSASFADCFVPEELTAGFESPVNEECKNHAA